MNLSAVFWENTDNYCKKSGQMSADVILCKKSGRFSHDKNEKADSNPEIRGNCPHVSFLQLSDLLDCLAEFYR